MDRFIYTGIIVTTLISVHLLGDQLHIGLWYYLTIPIIALIIATFFKPTSYYLSGTGFAIFITYIPYYWLNLTAIHPEGLLGLGHIFSLPGLFLGIIFSARYMRNRRMSTYYPALFGFSASLSGYAINQLLVCNSVMYCGSVLTFLNL